MTVARSPYLRMLVLTSLAALADEEFQQRVWVGKASDYEDSVSENIHTLYDDTNAMTDEPDDLLGWTLLPGQEVARLRALDVVFGPVVDELGTAPDEVYLADPRWPLVRSAARAALTAAVIDGIGYVPAVGDGDDAVVSPPARAAILDALARVADPAGAEGVDRAWAVLEADPRLLGSPDQLVGEVLLGGDPAGEVDRLRGLGEAVAAGRLAVRDAAARALTAMVLDGLGFVPPGTVEVSDQAG